MSVSLQKIPGIESVTVSLNKGMASIRLKSANAVTFEQVLQRVRDNGFTPKEAKITAVGQVTSSGEKLRFSILGTNETYDLAFEGDGSIGDEARKQPGKTLTLHGVIPSSKDKNARPVIQVQSLAF